MPSSTQPRIGRPRVTSEPGPLWFREIAAGHLASLRRKGRRPNTLTAYKYELRALGHWLDREAIANAEQLTGQQLERWQDFRAGEVVPRTQQIAATAVRAALRWAAIQEPPMAAPTLWLRISTPHTARLLPRPIPRADLKKVIAAIAPRPAPSDLERLRTRALFLVILSSGARISEALSLDRDQLQGRAAMVIQKGGSEKLVLISAAADEAIADYLDARSDKCPALFVEHGPGRAWLAGLANPQPDLQLPWRVRKGVQVAWDHLCLEVGIPRFTSHQIRHTCATELLRQHVDSLVIAKHMGHRDLSSIGGYAEVGLDEREQMLEVLDERMRRAS
jgi:integrase/recombinase XerD